MVTRKRTASARAKATIQDAVPSVYREMLSEAGVGRSSQNAECSEPPRKRQKRPGEKPAPKLPPQDDPKRADSCIDDDFDLEDVAIPAPIMQTIMRDDSDEEEDDDIQFENADPDPFGPSVVPASQGHEELTLNLTLQRNFLASRRATERKKVITADEKNRRVEVHKMHLLCLLAHVEQRNRWCNDDAVHDALRPLLSEKMVRLLNPRASLIQFGRTESLKNGLLETTAMFKPLFKVTERGMKRALWPEDEEQFKDYKPLDDAETIYEKNDFLAAAKKLEGSRDVGAQLFCALLRCAGVEARLVCSLQPLAFAPGAPTMPKQRKEANTPKKSRGDIYAEAMAKYQTTVPNPSPRRRLGHPNAAAYNVPSITPPRPPPEPVQKSKVIRGESPYPIYWVEVLDVARQKWHPVDPIVTGTQWRPNALEPPAKDKENCMSYVVAFEADGSARDVTRRYVKAFNSKTKRMRLDGMNLPANRNTAATPTDGSALLNFGERWWRRALRHYRRLLGPTDLDQIELAELTAEEGKEPMPRNVADFKDHPVYALERHLRRNEVLVPDAQMSGTVSAGAKATIERVYRRRDVRVARSRDRWYRLGRIIKPGEEAVKVLPKPPRRSSQLSGNEYSDEDDPDKVGLFGDALAGIPIYMPEQTELYVPPPVVNGIIPKNRFKNIEVYVPSMVPAGGAHIMHDRAAHAAHILGVDYAPALMGFEFTGRKGTAVLRGAVVPKEAEEGVWAVIRGLEDLEAELEEERRSKRALRMWSRFLKVLRIRERVYAGVKEGEAEGEEKGEDDRAVKGKGKEVTKSDEDAEMSGAVSDVSEEYYMEEDEEGGGFIVGDVDDNDQGGGFTIE